VDVGDLEAAGLVGLDVRVQILPNGGIHLGHGDAWAGAGDGAAEGSRSRSRSRWWRRTTSGSRRLRI
jgi:hypothetical protein